MEKRGEREREREREETNDKRGMRENEREQERNKLKKMQQLAKNFQFDTTGKECFLVFEVLKQLLAISTPLL